LGSKKREKWSDVLYWKNWYLKNINGERNMATIENKIISQLSIM